MDDKAILLRKRYDEGYTRMRNWHYQWEEIALFTMPGKADFITDRTEGDRQRQRNIYDPTAAVANHTLASHMHTAMTSPSAPWFELKFNDPAMEKQDAAKEWIEDCTKRMFSAINDSNFVAVINELYQDLIAFGTACIEVSYVNTADEGFRLVFRNTSLGNTVFHENIHGQVDTVQYEQKLKARDIDMKFPDHEIQVVKDVSKKNPDREFKMLRSVLPNDKYDKDKELNEANRKFISIWQYENEIVEETGYYEQPYMVPRWSKMTTEPFGFGPGLLAMPDIRSINEAKMYELRSWEKAIDPPLMGTAGGIVGDLHLEAGGFTQVRDIRAIAPLADQANWSAVQIKADEVRKNIQAVYLIDQLVLPERPNATATEVQIRYEMMQRVLGPTMGRLQSELLNPMVSRIFGIMFRNRMFNEMPEEIQGAETEVKYTGPLAKAQTANDASAIERLINALMALAQMDQTVMDVIDLQLATQALARQWGVPADVLRSADEIDELNAQRQAAQQQAAGQEQQMQQAQADQATAESSMAQVEAMRSVAGAM